MSWQIPTPDRPKLLRSVKAFLISKGWTAKEPERQDRRIDLIATNRELTYFITVVDEAQNRFFRLEKMIEGMAHDAYEIRGQKRQAIAYIVNFRSPSAILETLAERGVSAFMLDELEKLTNIVLYLDELPPPLGTREMALLAGNPKVCMSISDRFYKNGDRTSAIKWARHALTLRGGVNVAHTRLFQMYLEEGDLDNAERVGQEVFYFEPKNTEFLVRMEKLAINRNDHDSAMIYRAKRLSQENVPAPPKKFQDIIKNQQARRLGSAFNPKAATLSVEPKTQKVFISRLLDRLCGSGGGT